MIHMWDVLFGIAIAYILFRIPIGLTPAPKKGESADPSPSRVVVLERQLDSADAEIGQLKAIIETSSLQHEAVVLELRQLQEIKQIRQARQAPAGPRDGLELLRRGYHAVRILHDFRKCKLKGCEYCRLGEEIVASIGAHTIQSETTIRKKVME